MDRTNQRSPDWAKLVSRARGGDQQAIAALYEATYSGVYHAVRAMIREEQDALDILQDSYIKAFSHLDRFEGEEKFLPWMQQIARNTARDWLKKKRPALFSDLGGEEGAEAETPVEERFTDPDTANQPDAVLDQAETARLIREILDGLPEDQRAVIGMYYYEELSVKQIALALDVSESAVKSRLQYGRRKIETKVLELEKRGTKLYSLAPIPFLLWLLRCQEKTLAPNGAILQAVLAKTAGAARAGSSASGAAQAAGTSQPAGTASASGAAAAETASAVATAAAVGAKTAGLSGAVKLGLIALAAAAVIGTGAYGVSRLVRPKAQPAAPAAAASAVQSAPAESDALAPAPAEDPVERALEEYRAILAQADCYTYTQQAVTPTGHYQYALVQLAPEDPVPTLLLSQETEEYLWFIRVFQYDPESKTVLAPAESLTEGTAQVGGYRGGLGLMADGRGLRSISISGGTGATAIDRITLEDGALVTASVWNGGFTDPIPEEFSFVEILWHELGDTAPLESWSDPALEPSAEQAPEPEETLPVDGERIVFAGTVDTYSYEEVVALQGCPDPNAPWTDPSQSFRLVVLDTPQEMELQTGDPSPEFRVRSGEVRLIDVSLAEGLEQYDGQHLIFSIDPENTYWPTDTSMPVGQPSTRDLHILS